MSFSDGQKRFIPHQAQHDIDNNSSEEEDKEDDGDGDVSLDHCVAGWRTRQRVTGVAQLQRARAGRMTCNLIAA